jgi:hypothetical protein
VTAIQETFLSSTSAPPSFPEFALVRKDRPEGRGGGLIFLIHHSLPFTLVDTSFIQDAHTECQAIKVSINGSDLIIFNVYLPPVSSCPQTYCPNLSSVFSRFDDDVLVCGDLNAHHAAWDSSLSDPRGVAISNAVDISPLVTLNVPSSPTRFPKSGAPLSPDVTMASAHVALALTWTTHIQLNSDHLPITISLPSDDALPPRAAKTYTNFRKADWPMFIRESEAVFRSLERPTSCGAGEKIFHETLLSASKHAIPAGYEENACSE